MHNEALATWPVHNQSPNQFDQELRIRTDTETWLAEALNGNMRTSFDFYYDGQDLYGEDGGSLTEIFDTAIEDAQALTRANVSLAFELRRRLAEREELDEIKAMARGELGGNNTIVVVSDFPPELMASTEDVGGYNTNRKQTMLRVITREEDGSIRVTTQSLDSSNRQALEAIYKKLGQQPQEGELLSQRVHLDLPPAWQSQLVDNLTQTYDASLGEQYGGEWYAGRRPADDRNTYAFVRQPRQQQLVQWFTEQKLADPEGAEKLRFKLAATAEERFEQFLNGESETQPFIGLVTAESLITLQAIANQSLEFEMNRAERRAASLGKTYSGCGASVSSEETENVLSKDSISASGWGNKAGGGSDKYGSLRFKCPKGHENTRPRNKLIDKCTTCGTNVKC